MTPLFTDSHVTIFHGDAWDLASTLEPQSVQTIVTSPPYWGLRDYGEPGQFGLESTPEEYVARLVDLFALLRPALPLREANSWPTTRHSQRRRHHPTRGRRGVGAVHGHELQGVAAMIELPQFINADCMDVMKEIPDKYFELAIVDPPYGINLTGANVIKNKSDSNTVFNTEWDKSIPDKAYFEELMRVSKEQIIWGGNHFLDHLGYCKAPIIWDKLNGDNLYADGEMAWTSKGLPRNLKIWKHQWCGAFKDSERGAKKIHPTQKPVALYKWLLKNYAKEGDKILDTHVGSASSLIACEEYGFDYLGIELDPDYYQAAKDRLEKFKAQGKLF